MASYIDFILFQTYIIIVKNCISLNMNEGDFKWKRILGRSRGRLFFEPERGNVGVWIGVDSQNIIYELDGTRVSWSTCIDLMEGPLSEHFSATGEMSLEEALIYVRSYRNAFDAAIRKGLDFVLKDYFFVSDEAGNVVEMKV